MVKRRDGKYVINDKRQRCIVYMHPEYEQMQDFILTLPKKFAQGEGIVIHKGRNELRMMTHAGQEYVVKSFHRPHFVNAMVYGTLRASKAERSLRNAELLTRIGVGTPQPIGYMEVRRHGLLTESYYVTKRSSCPYVFSQLFEQKFSYEDDVLSAIGLLTAKMHNQGYAHKDYGRGNILFGQQNDGSILIEVVDLNRMYFGKIDMRRGCKNMERLPLTPHMRRVLAMAYATNRGFDVQKCYELLEHFRSSQPGKIDGKY